MLARPLHVTAYMNLTPQGELAALSELPDYRVCAEDSDPRGWSIVDADGIPLGEVHDLIIDLEGLTARYIVCSLSGGHARSVLIPTGFARIEKDRCVLHLDFVAAADTDRLPAFRGLPIDAALIADTEKVLTGVTPTTSQRAKIVRRSDETRNAS